jgi:hypothetical protein
VTAAHEESCWLAGEGFCREPTRGWVVSGYPGWVASRCVKGLRSARSEGGSADVGRWFSGAVQRLAAYRMTALIQASSCSCTDGSCWAERWSPPSSRIRRLGWRAAAKIAWVDW